MWYMNEERELLQGAFREFAQTRVRPYVSEMEEKDADCKDLIKEMGELGFLGLNMPEEFGGSGCDYINEALLLEELAKESYVVAFSAMLVHMFDTAMVRGCSDEQKQKYLVPSIQGEMLMGLAGNEALGGSFLEGFSTKAVRDGDTWTINGTKVLVSQSDVADVFMVMAVTENFLDIFFVSEGTDGLSHGHIENKLQPPSAEHWMGTDELGRDIFSRVVYGARVSLRSALGAVGLSLLIGVPLGAIAGSFGGWVDNVIMRLTDVFLSFPPLLLAIAMVAVLGSSLNNAVLAISLSWWPWYTRLIRGQAISVKERKFVQAAETIGTSKLKIIFRHIMPNCISPVIVQASMDIGGVILTVASLSFLGLGAQLPTPEWGLMISMGRTYFPDKWWYCIFPGVAIFITVLCFNLIGDAIREILDPKTRKK